MSDVLWPLIGGLNLEVEGRQVTYRWEERVPMQAGGVAVIYIIAECHWISSLFTLVRG